MTDIAEAEGIGRTVASTVANSPECRAAHRGVRKRGTRWDARHLYRYLRAIEHATSARREYMTKEGQILYGGPDHYVRLAATNMARRALRYFIASQLRLRAR